MTAILLTGRAAAWLADAGRERADRLLAEAAKTGGARLPSEITEALRLLDTLAAHWRAQQNGSMEAARVASRTRSLSAGTHATPKVAGRLLGGLTARRVLQLVQDGELQGSKVGGRWQIDLDSVRTLEERRANR